MDAFAKSCIDAGCAGVRAHLDTNGWMHGIFDPFQKAHANSMKSRDQDKHVEKDNNDSKPNIFPDTVRQEPNTSASSRNSQSILRLTDTKTISFGKSIFGGSKKTGAGTGNTHLTQDLLRSRLRRSRNDNLPARSP